MTRTKMEHLSAEVNGSVYPVPAYLAANRQNANEGGRSNADAASTGNGGRGEATGVYLDDHSYR
ncbi:MAG: hypothetical protein K8S25_01615 [Alphaproteobacteria bacterium]|nr:hypothetical protein [Alphaproteobacteria bacterium]